MAFLHVLDVNRLVPPPASPYIWVMNTVDTQWFTTSIDLLSDPQNQRVWSIIVSLFGDLAQQPKAKISGSALTAIITPMGIKPEAIRVALHRLRKDGWIESSRSGRASTHYLTRVGRSQSAAVSPRIYAAEEEPTGPWHLLIAGDNAPASALDEVLLLPTYIPINRATALGQGPSPRKHDDLLAVDIAAISPPEWLKARLFPADLRDNCRELLTALQALPPFPGHMTPLQVAALRTLIVHRWRRVVLRHADMPRSFQPSDWVGSECRQNVLTLLDQLPRPAPADLNSHFTP